MKNEPNELAAQIIRHYGAEHQKDILIEECAELIQATEKTRRFGETTELTSDMVKEMADVQIMLWEFMSLMSGYWDDIFGQMVSGKLRRQIDRIEKEVEDST